jgi:hypothetical protein
MGELGFDRETEGNARAKLESRGLIAFAGKVGAKHRLFQLTPRGREFAAAMGLAVSGTGKGSVAHESIICYVQLSLSRFSATFRFQRRGASSTTGGVQPDLLVVAPDGSRIPVQACYGNQPSYEAAALLKLCRLLQLGPGDADRVDFVLAVCVNRHHRNAIERALKNQNGGSLPDKFAALDFDVAISPDFDWNSVFEGFEFPE